MKQATLFLLCQLLLLPAMAVAQDDSRKAFDSLYAEKLKAVRATGDRADDYELARKLVESAAATVDAPALVVHMCNAAYELTSTQPAGYAIAAQAMKVMVEKAPGRIVDGADRLVDMMRKVYARAQGEERAPAADQLIDAMLLAAQSRAAGGDYVEAIKQIKQAILIAEGIKSPRVAELKAKQDQAQAKAQLEGQLKRAQARIAANPKDGAAHAELAKLFLVEFDDLAKARTHAEASEDAAVKSIVTNAGKAVNDLTDRQALELADWFRAAAATSAQGKTAALERAKAGYTRYLATTQEAGLNPATAKLSLEEVDKALAAIATAAKAASVDAGKSKVTVMETLATIKPEDGWVDVMKVLDPAKPYRGAWTEEKGKLTCRTIPTVNESGFLDVPFSGLGVSYEVELVVERVVDIANAGVNMYMHAGKATFYFEMGQGVKADQSGINYVDGKPFFQNESLSEKVSFTAGKQFTVLISVKLDGDKTHIKSTANGKPLVEWKGAGTSLQGMSVYPKMGIGGRGTVTFHSVRLRAVEGELTARTR